MMKVNTQNSASIVGERRSSFCLINSVCLDSIRRVPSFLLLFFTVSLMVAFPALAETADELSIKRGEYIYIMGGCESCHTDDSNKQLGPVGGVDLETPFGTFHTPNITPDSETGIGGWSDRQFLDAMRKGLSPDGEHYFPSFPYTSYTKMSDRDLLDLKAYLDSLSPVSHATKTHDLSFPFNQRWLMGIWKLLFFEQQPFQPISSRTDSWNRGAYIVNGPGHCAECHTPRNIFGGLKRDELLAGTPDGPDGESVPPINPQKGSSFKKWTETDIVFALQTGMLPDGDFVGGSMGPVIENCTSKLSDVDLRSIAEYLISPQATENSGFLSVVSGSANDAVAQAGSAINGQAGVLSSVIRWVFWLLLISGFVWLVSVLLNSKRPDPRNKNGSDFVRAQSVGKEIEKEASNQQRRERQ